MTSPGPIARVVTVSDRSAAGVRPDVSGPRAAELLNAAGWRAEVEVVPDETTRIRDAVTRATRAGARLIITTGGTGVSARDVTPDAMDDLFQREIPGIADAIRRAGTVPQAMLSRGRAGIVDTALVVNLAGSPGAVDDGIPVVLTVAGHVVAQLDGEDHG